MPPIDPAERARRLGNVAAILIELARREQAVGNGISELLTIDGSPIVCDQPEPDENE